MNHLLDLWPTSILYWLVQVWQLLYSNNRFPHEVSPIWFEFLQELSSALSSNQIALSGHFCPLSTRISPGPISINGQIKLLSMLIRPLAHGFSHQPYRSIWSILRFRPCTSYSCVLVRYTVHKRACKMLKRWAYHDAYPHTECPWSSFWLPSRSLFISAARLWFAYHWFWLPGHWLVCWGTFLWG